MAGDVHVTTDHDEIRRWVEDQGGRPVEARVPGADVTVLDIQLPGDSARDNLVPIPWDDWFERFENDGLSLLYDDGAATGEGRTFTKLMQR